MAEGVTPAVPHARTDDLRRGLREAFTGEVATRLPALRRALTAVEDSANPQAVREVVRHAHSLGSSAAVLGEEIASRHARDCELIMGPHVESGQPPPARDVRSAAKHVATLEVLLAPWLTGSGGDD